MRAIVQTAYGSPEVVRLDEIEPPVVKDDSVLVRVRAASLHAGDCYIMRGVPYVARFFAGWPRPRKGHVVGLSLAGTVEAVGAGVTRFKPGDEVFGEGSGSCAELAVGTEDTLALKPTNLTFEQAAAVPTSALSALHGLRDAGKLRPGQKVLINGASGGVGGFAVQIAKALGAEVTGVCSTSKVETVRLLGADHVIDYTAEDFTDHHGEYDLILDNVANRSFADMRRALTPDGVVIPNSGNSGIGYIITASLRSTYASQQGRPYLSEPNAADLDVLKGLAEAGRLAPVIDRVYPLSETPVALGYVDAGHARGKVVIRVAPDDETAG